MYIIVESHCNYVVPRSSLLQSICYNVPQHPGTSLSLQITVPIRKEILVTIQELLYTGQVHRTKKEIEEVSNGLALLGINDFSGPPQFIHPGITAIPLPPNTVATKQSTGSQTPEFLKSVAIQSNPVPPGPSPTNNTSAKFDKLDVTHSNNLGLLIQKVVPSPLSCKKEVNETNNNEEEEVPDGGRSKRLRKRRKKTIYSDAGSLSDSEEIELDGTPITEEIRSKKKERCGKMMSSRHDYQVGVRCPECDTPLRSTWYLPPSRHNCTAAANHNVSIDTVKDTQEEDQRSRKSRRLSLGSELISPSPLVANPSDFETPTRPNQFSCPLKGCFRKCDTKKHLMLHLAFTHYLEKLESKYIIQQPIGNVEIILMLIPDYRVSQNKIGFTIFDNCEYS